MTGNGAFDGAKNFGECFIKLRGDGTVVDWWTPYRDSDRGKTGGWDDQDLGAGGPVVIPELGLVLGAGKDGILYVLDWRKMGKPQQPGHYELLKSPAIFFTYFPGFGVNAAPANPKELDRLWFDKTHHQHGSPVVWKSDQGYRLFCWGENGNLRLWSIDGTGKVQFLARSAEVASPFAPAVPGGMPGAMMCLTANGGKDGIIWCCVPDGDANKQVTTGRVFAFDAQDFGRLDDGDAQLRRLWMSGPDHYVYNKFNVPVVSGGKLYVPTYSGTVEVWGL
jgi:hypothetical protein